jgi:hypothetical protein
MGQASGHVIFVHGVNGGYSTWGFDEEGSWKDFLIKNRPDLTIWALEYSANTSGFRGTSLPLSDRSITALSSLRGIDDDGRPICFIAYSMGGLVFKQVVRTAVTMTAQFGNIAERIKGVAFFATPHAGSRLADLGRRLDLFGLFTVSVAELSWNNAQLRDLNNWFRQYVLQSKIPCVVFYETQRTMGIKVVEEISADPGLPNVTPIPIETDHLAISRSVTEFPYVGLETLSLLAKALPRNTGDTKNDIDKLISELHGEYLAAKSDKDLERVLRKVIRFLEKHPSDERAENLLSEIANIHQRSQYPNASVREELPETRAHRSMPAPMDRRHNVSAAILTLFAFLLSFFEIVLREAHDIAAFLLTCESAWNSLMRFLH